MSVVQTIQYRVDESTSSNSMDLHSKQPNSTTMTPYHVVGAYKSNPSYEHTTRKLISKDDCSKNNDYHSDDSIGRSDAVSECTNPYLETLLDRYFPDDDEEDYGCEADVEFDYDDLGIDKRKKERMTPTGSPRRYQTKNSGSRSPSSRKRTRANSRHLRAPSSTVVTDDYDEKKSDGFQQHGNLNTAQWLEEARRQFVAGEVRKQKEQEKININNHANPWDSSPSTIHDDMDDSSDSDILKPQHQIQTGDNFNNHSNDISNMDPKNSLFAPIRENSRLLGVMSMTDNYEQSDDCETDNEDDLELTYRARQIQHDLRLQEMRELAIEAERAAEEGKEKFVGSATRFGHDDTLSQVSSQLDTPRSMVLHLHQRLPTCGKIASTFKEQDYFQQLHSPKLSTITHRFSPPQKRKLPPRTDLKRPKPLSLKDRLASAPSKLQNRNSSPTISNVPSTVSSILTAKSFLSRTQTKINENKVPVLSLRHIEEVIPTFGEMHPFVRSHMIRNGVKKDMLTLHPAKDTLKKSRLRRESSNADNNDRDNDERGSATGSRVSSNSLFPRIQSFHKLLNSFSGLSVEDSSQQRGKGIVDSDLEFATGSEGEIKADDCNVVINADCTSLVSCGESSFEENFLAERNEDKRQALFKGEDTKYEMDGDTDNLSVDADDNHLNIIMSTSEQSEIYVCTLASEINTPGRRPRSPPIQPPYYDIDDSIKDMLRAELVPTTGSPPKSRWTAFWANISPSRKMLQPLPKRSSSLPIHPIAPLPNNIDDDELEPPSSLRYSWLDRSNHSQIDFLNKLPFRERLPGTETNVNMMSPRMEKMDTLRSLGSSKTSATQKSSCESESNESAFSLYSSQPKNGNSMINKKDSASSMQSIRENDNLLFDGSLKFLNDLNARDTESAISPKPPLHPAGISKLTTTLLNNTNCKTQHDEESERSSKDVNVQRQPQKFSSERLPERMETQTERKLKNDMNDDSSPPKQAIKRKTCKEQENQILQVSTENIDICRKTSFSSIPSCCVGEEMAVDEDTTSIHGVSYGEIITKVENPDDIMSSDDEKNESVSSFMELMDNVNVPSVMDRLSPLLGRKTHQAHQDDTAFIGNYFYVGVESESDDKIETHETFEDYSYRRNSRFCDRGSCAEVGCVDFGAFTIERTFNILSKKSSWDKESGPLLNEPKQYDDHQPWLRKALSQCAGQKQNQQRRDLVIIGGKSFRAPNLQIQKANFFTRNNEDEAHEPFKVGRSSSIHSQTFAPFQDSLTPRIEIDSIKEDNETFRNTTIDYIGLPMKHVEDNMESNHLKDKVHNHKSILTFSDDENSDNL